MFEFIVIAVILFGGGLAFGLVTGRSWIALPLAVVLSVVAGICVGEWPGYRTMFASWDQFHYARVTIVGYFAIVIVPGVVGAIAGILIRRAVRVTKNDDS